MANAATCSSSNPYRNEYGSSPFDVPFVSMVSFGDSYLDLGRVFEASNGTSPSPLRSWKGRYADGPAWLEYVSKYFQSSITTSYAWGGSTSNNSYIHAYSSYLNANVPAVDEQVDEYIQTTEEISPDTLHVLSSGYNDYWWYVYRNYSVVGPDGQEQQDLDLQSVASNIAYSMIMNIKTLYDYGARQFLLTNMFDLNKAPEVLSRSSQVMESYDTLIFYHNKYLSEYTKSFLNGMDDATIYYQDLHKLINCIHAESFSLGFFETVTAFYGGDEVGEDSGALINHMWWDEYHPTTRSHFYIASDAIQTIYDSITDNTSKKTKKSSKK
eukprot:CAMPEP_0194242568 /NCGR_PEP_ID=MMETSP0158-20130606/8070_1 /TAXON_ID=33649 /ORGANISM="Thalassionema nitzschioides, Strain L26-B" /LENGTH=325 /DNA_ID=CAMNT_0038977685 /DNA_START=109 /DNA_END=1086 /DNA_ORIENTATION=-